MTVSINEPKPAPKIGFKELVAIIAAVMALNALAIDMMLPALGLISEDLALKGENERQLIIVLFVIANGFGQLFFGPLVDRYGRRTVLMWSLGGYILGSILSIVATSFTLLLAARCFQGIATAATRVATVAIVRDLCEGRKMAQVMSLAVTIFMAAPILAPGLGQLVLMAFPWRGIFIALMLYGVILAIWLAIRLPETLETENRKPLNVKGVANSYMEFVRNRISIGYTIAAMFCFGALFGYISASEQIFLEQFSVGSAFAGYFAITACGLAAATLANARFVEQYGMRRISHSAFIGLTLLQVLHLLSASLFGETLIGFMIFMVPSFFCLGLIGTSSAALALQPMGHNAGAAAAANGFASTAGAGVFGGLVGSFYNGTTFPIITGFLLLALCGLIVILWTEHGKLFQIGEAERQNQ